MMLNTNDTLNIEKESHLVNEISLTHRKNIEKEIRITLVDKYVDDSTKSEIEMFCYDLCTDDDTDLIKKSRGVVFDKENIVMLGFDYTQEFNHTQKSEIESCFGELDQWSIYESHEGACIRVYNRFNKWFISTNKKIDAYNSKWSSDESFGVMFENAIREEYDEGRPLEPNCISVMDRFFASLDSSRQYMFVVRNTSKNRIVCSAPSKPTVYHTGTVINGVVFKEDNIGIKKPLQIEMKNVEDVISYVFEEGYSKIQGVICFNENTKKQIRVVSKDYQDLFNARGNEPSVKFRALQVRMDQDIYDMLYYLYPNEADGFDQNENIIYDIATSIYKAYVDRFIKKLYVTMDSIEYSVMKECHAWHTSDRVNNKMSCDHVMRVINKKSAVDLNTMINRSKKGILPITAPEGTVFPKTFIPKNKKQE
jgi:hypothetical protein